MIHLRKHPRFTVSTPVVVTFTDGVTRTFTGTISDISESGLRLEAPMAIPIGVAVQVDVEEAVYFGEVRNSGLELGKWVVGIELLQWIDKHWLEQLLRRLGPGTDSRSRMHESSRFTDTAGGAAKGIASGHAAG